MRTMVADAEVRWWRCCTQRTRGTLFKIAKDPRITRVGRMLQQVVDRRAAAIRQVLRNEMSVVGSPSRTAARGQSMGSDFKQRCE